MLTNEQIRSAEADVVRLHARIYEALPFRAKGELGRHKWQEACREFQAYTGRLYEFVRPQILEQIRAGAQPWRAALILLEADPWFFWSGYMKGRVARALKHVAFTEVETRRVVAIVLAVVNGKDRKEFKDYCRLAKRAATAELRAGLEHALESTDRRTRSRAAQMLSYLEKFS
jgi:hypothetical protein